MDLAKEMTKEALPIKCLEAVILGMYPFLLELCMSAHPCVSSSAFSCFEAADNIVTKPHIPLFSLPSSPKKPTIKIQIQVIL